MMVVLHSKVLKQHVLIMVSVKYLHVKMELNKLVLSNGSVKLKDVKTTRVNFDKC